MLILSTNLSFIIIIVGAVACESTKTYWMLPVFIGLAIINSLFWLGVTIINKLEILNAGISK